VAHCTSDTCPPCSWQRYSEGDAMNEGLVNTHVHCRFVTLRAISKACMLWRLSMTDLQVCTSFHIWEPVQPVMMPSDCPSSSLSTALRGGPTSHFHKTVMLSPLQPFIYSRSTEVSTIGSVLARAVLLHLLVNTAQPCITCRALSLLARGIDLACSCPCNSSFCSPPFLWLA